MAPTDETNVILTRTEDWLTWISFVRRAAVRRGVWEYIDPDTATKETYPTSPTAPIFPALRQEDGSPVGNIAALKDLYAAEVADYNIRLQAFKEKKKDLDYMDDLIERMTARRIKTYTTTATNVREALKLLKEHLRADKVITMITLERRWDTLRTQDLGRSKLTTWIYEIQDTYAQLKEINSGLVQGWKPYIDVLDKIKTISRATVSIYYTKLKDWIYKNKDKQKDRSFLSFIDKLLYTILANIIGIGYTGSLFILY
jgi:hypothetical protein